MSLTIIPVNPLLLLRYISSMHKVARLQGKRKKSKEQEPRQQVRLRKREVLIP